MSDHDVTNDEQDRSEDEPVTPAPETELPPLEPPKQMPEPTLPPPRD